MSDERGFKVQDRRRFDESGEEREGVEDSPRIDEPLVDEAQELPEIDFSTFILSLGTSAMVHLGDAPDPGGKSERNLPLAKQTIDILGLLEQKTQGNLTEDEERLMTKLLYDLRLRFVDAAK